MDLISIDWKKLKRWGLHFYRVIHTDLEWQESFVLFKVVERRGGYYFRPKVVYLDKFPKRTEAIGFYSNEDWYDGYDMPSVFDEEEALEKLRVMYKYRRHIHNVEGFNKFCRIATTYFLAVQEEIERLKLAGLIKETSWEVGLCSESPPTQSDCEHWWQRER